jgi:hypothetical protein
MPSLNCWATSGDIVANGDRWREKSGIRFHAVRTERRTKRAAGSSLVDHCSKAWIARSSEWLHPVSPTRSVPIVRSVRRCCSEKPPIGVQQFTRRAHFPCQRAIEGVPLSPFGRGRLIRVHPSGSPPEQKHRISLSTLMHRPPTLHHQRQDNPNNNTLALRRCRSHINQPRSPPTTRPSRAANKHPNAYTNHTQSIPTSEPTRHRCLPQPHPQPLLPTLPTLLRPRRRLPAPVRHTLHAVPTDHPYTIALDGTTVPRTGAYVPGAHWTPNPANAPFAADCAKPNAS